MTFGAFDLLFLDGQSMCSLPYRERRLQLQDLGLRGPCWHVVDALDCHPLDALAGCLELGLEGVVAKRLDGLYRPGQRSSDWVKLKTPEWRAMHADRLPG